MSETQKNRCSVPCRGSGNVLLLPSGRRLVKEIKSEVRTCLSSRGETLTDEQVLELIEGIVFRHGLAKYQSPAEKKRLVDHVFCSMRRELDILQPFADDEDVSEIMVNGIDSIFIERKGKQERVPACFDSENDLEELIRRLAGKVHREINELNPIVDARLEDGSRINAVYKNVAINGPILTIRRFPKSRITMKDLLETKSITEEAAAFLEKIVRAGYNIFISGGTSSGKTTFLNILSDFIPKEDRVVVIEDSSELQIAGIDNLVRLETRNANVQGKGQVTMRQLIKASLRMRPDRIIVGEVRGEEIMDMVQAMNTGHDGSLSTGHGNSAEGMLRRLEAMFLSAANFPIEAIRGQITEAIDIIVHLGRMPDRSRRVLEIAELAYTDTGRIRLNPLFAYSRENGLSVTGNAMIRKQKLEMKGYRFEKDD